MSPANIRLRLLTMTTTLGSSAPLTQCAQSGGIANTIQCIVMFFRGLLEPSGYHTIKNSVKINQVRARYNRVRGSHVNVTDNHLSPATDNDCHHEQQAPSVAVLCRSVLVVFAISELSLLR